MLFDKRKPELAWVCNTIGDLVTHAQEITPTKEAMKGYMEMDEDDLLLNVKALEKKLGASPDCRLKKPIDMVRLVESIRYLPNIEE